MDGWGEFLWNDRKYYIGEYKDGIKHGFGIYVSDFKKLDCYIGFWEYGKVSGLGVKIDGDNLKIGVWKDGRRINWIKNWEMKDGWLFAILRVSSRLSFRSNVKSPLSPT